MKEWKCPNCKRVRYWEEGMVMKICNSCQIEMEVVDDGK